MSTGQLVRLAERDRRKIRLVLGRETIEALEGDTLLTALLLAGRRLRLSEFGDGGRAGFCLMGSHQPAGLLKSMRHVSDLDRRGLRLGAPG